MLEHGITKERLPFVYGWHRLIGDRADRGAVRRAAVEAVTEHYRDIGIDVVNSTGDQFSLLCESLPGDKVRLNSYAAAPAAVHDRGRDADRDRGPRRPDRRRRAGWIGPYIGETLGRARSVVHFDPLVAAARNRPTAVAITGEPGGGKTTLALLLIYQLALRGRDDRGDRPEGRRGVAGQLLKPRGRKARVLPLGRRAPGLLDPFSFGDDLAEQADDGDRDAAAAAAADERGARVRDDPGGRRGRGAERPSLGKVVELPRGSRRPGVEEPRRGAAARCRRCGWPGCASRRPAASGSTPQGWTTVFTLGGLTLPDVGDLRGRTTPTSSGCRWRCCTWCRSSRGG